MPKENSIPEGFVLVAEDELEQLKQFKDLYKRAVLSARKLKSTVNWAHVSNLGVGGKRAQSLCRELGIDPESNNLHAPYNKENQK